MQNVEVPIKLLSTIGGDATFRVSQRQGWRNRSWGRPGGYCGGRSGRRGLSRPKGTEEGWLWPSPCKRNPYEGVLVPLSRRFAFCRVRTCDLRCVMRRRLMCVHHHRLLRSGTYVIHEYAYVCMCIYVCLHTHILHDATLPCVHSLILSGRPGSAVQRQRVGGVVQQGLGENASSEGAVE